MSAESDLPQGHVVVARADKDEILDGVSVGPDAPEIEESAPDVLPPPKELSVGQRLREAREAKGLSVQDVAGRLKLSLHQVDAIESDDWTRLQCNTITRGFVRNYARLVGLDGAVLMALLDQLTAPPVKELAVPTNINVKVPDEYGVERRDYIRVAGGFLVLALSVLAYFFLPTDFVQTAYSGLKDRISSKSDELPVKAVEPERRVSEPEAAPVLAAPVAVSEPAPPAVMSPSPAPAPVAPPVSAPVSEVPAAPAAKTTEAMLKLGFSKPSWVEIKDRTGQVIFSQLSPAGAQRDISGQPPFALVIGNAGNVTVTYKGNAVDLSSRRSKDDVARLTLE